MLLHGSKDRIHGVEAHTTWASTFHLAPRSQGRLVARWAFDAYGALAALVFGFALGGAGWVAAYAIVDGFALGVRAAAWPVFLGCSAGLAALVFFRAGWMLLVSSKDGKRFRLCRRKRFFESAIAFEVDDGEERGGWIDRIEHPGKDRIRCGSSRATAKEVRC